MFSQISFSLNRTLPCLFVDHELLQLNKSYFISCNNKQIYMKREKKTQEHEKKTKMGKREMVVLLHVHMHWHISSAYMSDMLCTRAAQYTLIHVRVLKRIFDQSCDKNWYFGSCDLNENVFKYSKHILIVEHSTVNTLTHTHQHPHVRSKW